MTQPSFPTCEHRHGIPAFPMEMKDGRFDIACLVCGERWFGTVCHPTAREIENEGERVRTGFRVRAVRR